MASAFKGKWIEPASDQIRSSDPRLGDGSCLDSTSYGGGREANSKVYALANRVIPITRQTRMSVFARPDGGYHYGYCCCCCPWKHPLMEFASSTPHRPGPWTPAWLLRSNGESMTDERFYFSCCKFIQAGQILGLNSLRHATSLVLSDRWSKGSTNMNVCSGPFQEKL